MAKKKTFELTWAKAWLGSLLVVVAGVIGLVVTQYVPSGEIADALQGVSSTLVGVGAIALVYDIAIRNSYTRELMQLMGLSDHIARSGVQKVVRDSEISWTSLLEDATVVTMVLIDGAAMAEREWQHVLRASRVRETQVRVFLPEGSGPLVGEYAAHRELDTAEFAESLARTQRTLEDSWKNALTSDPPIRSGSTLKIYRASKIINAPMVFIDDTAIVLLPQCQRREAGEGMLALQFSIIPDEPSGQWLASQRRRLESNQDVPVYENKA